VLLVAVAVVALLGGGTAFALSRIGGGGAATGAAGTAGTATTAPADPAGTMPNVVGSSVDSATAELVAAGLPPPTVLEEIDTLASDGQILSQVPAAGTTRPGSVALVVARAPVVTYLADLHSSDDDPDTGARQIAGHAYPQSISASTSRCDKRSTFEYNLRKHYRQVDAVVGLEDGHGSTSAKVLFEAFLDDRPVFTRTVAPNQAVPLQARTQNAERLTLRLTYVGPSGGDCRRAIAVWGGARLLGVPSEVPTPDPTGT
jgi:hypothetical protein